MPDGINAADHAAGCRPRWTISAASVERGAQASSQHGARRYGDHECRSDGGSDLRSPTAASRRLHRPASGSVSETSSPLLVVDVASMAKPDDDHQQHVVLDRVDDPVVADPDTKTRPTSQGACTRRARILGEQRDCTLDPTANLRVEVVHGADCRRTKLDAIRAHSQPRSALTCSQGIFGPSSAIAASKAATSSASSRAVINCS